jgi:hypothetical protein
MNDCKHRNMYDKELKLLSRLSILGNTLKTLKSTENG